MGQRLLPITVTVVTLNEEHNIERLLNSLQWVQEIIVVDSGSTDRTCEIAKKLGAKVFFNAWQGYGKQKNFAQTQATFDWILNLDADECIPENLANEVAQVFLNNEFLNKFQAFSIKRKTFFLNQWIRYGGWYPNSVPRLYNKKHAKWSEPELHEALQVNGAVFELKEPMWHFTFSDLEDQVYTNVKYAKAGAAQLSIKGSTPSILLLILKPIGKFLETYFWKLGFLDGLRGFLISINAAYSMFLKYAFFLEKNKKFGMEKINEYFGD